MWITQQSWTNLKEWMLLISIRTFKVKTENLYLLIYVLGFSLHGLQSDCSDNMSSSIAYYNHMHYLQTITRITWYWLKSLWVLSKCKLVPIANFDVGITSLIQWTKTLTNYQHEEYIVQTLKTICKQWKYMHLAKGKSVVFMFSLEISSQILGLRCWQC